MPANFSDNDLQVALWFSRLVRWGFGTAFVLIGAKFIHDDGWPALMIGVAFFISGFFKPRRCIEGECEL